MRIVINLFAFPLFDFGLENEGGGRALANGVVCAQGSEKF